MKKIFVPLYLVIAIAAAIGACTPIGTQTSQPKKKTSYGITKLDSTRGWAYPVDLSRARELRRAEMFSEAAYIYILLYPTMRDSVMTESIAMANEVRSIDSVQSVGYYFQQAIGKEIMLDPEVRKPGEEIDQKEMKKRYQWSSDLMNELAALGIR